MLLGDFAGLRGGARKPCAGLLAVPPQEREQELPTTVTNAKINVAETAADRVRQKFAALAPTGSKPSGARIPGIAPAKPSQQKTAAEGEKEVLGLGSEVYLFKCHGEGCRHNWISGRGATSSEQICKCCGESVVGTLVQGAVHCELMGGEDAGEVIRIMFEKPLSPKVASNELEVQLQNHLHNEILFFMQFLHEDEGLAEYIRYRRAGGDRGEDGRPVRDGKQDVRLLERVLAVVEALVRAEFQGTMRGGEADAKLQAFMRGDVVLKLAAPVQRAGAAGMGAMTLHIDFDIALDVEDRLADKVDDRLHSLRKVMREMDGKLLEKAPQPNAKHPCAWLARFISSIDWQRAMTSVAGREQHDRVRCMTCRFLAEECSSDVARSRDVRRQLRVAPAFLFCSTVTIGRQDKGGRTWEDRCTSLLESIAATKGGECYVLASVDNSDCLSLTLVSRPDWLAAGVDRLLTLIASGASAVPSMTSLVGLGRAAKGLITVSPSIGKRPQFEAVRDLHGFMGAVSLSKRVQWNRSKPRSSLVGQQEFDAVRQLFRDFSGLQELTDLVDFLKDFRQGGSALAKPEPRPPKPPDRTSVVPSLSRSRVVKRTPSPQRAAARLRRKKRKQSSSASSTQSSRQRKSRRRSPSYTKATRASPSRSRMVRASPSVQRPESKDAPPEIKPMGRNHTDITDQDIATFIDATIAQVAGEASSPARFGEQAHMTAGVASSQQMPQAPARVHRVASPPPDRPKVKFGFVAAPPPLP